MSIQSAKSYIYQRINLSTQGGSVKAPAAYTIWLNGSAPKPVKTMEFFIITTWPILIRIHSNSCSLLLIRCSTCRSRTKECWFFYLLLSLKFSSEWVPVCPEQQQQQQLIILVHLHEYKLMRRGLQTLQSRWTNAAFVHASPVSESWSFQERVSTIWAVSWGAYRTATRVQFPVWVWPGGLDSNLNVLGIILVLLVGLSFSRWFPGT